MEMEIKTSILKGTASYDNWQAYCAKEPELATSEFLLYTDAPLTGKIPQLGPFHFIYLSPAPSPGNVQPAIVLRTGIHIHATRAAEGEEKDQKRYHGGNPIDETVALASLLIGIRLKCGAQIRSFRPNADPRGQPLLSLFHPEPFLALKPPLKLPYTAQEHSLISLEDLTLFPRLSADDAVVLVRAARLYQEALWIAELDQSLAWLWFVSALETAANQWQSSKRDPIEALRLARPDLVNALEQAENNPDLKKVAMEFGKVVRAGQKVRDFIIEFLPDPPSLRPYERGQIDWSNIHPVLATIYDCRSKFLHDGIPFPFPMCEIPFPDRETGAFTEKPLGDKMVGGGGFWRKDDAPMLLHTFEYITRNALVKWWKERAAHAE